MTVPLEGGSAPRLAALVLFPVGTSPVILVALAGRLGPLQAGERAASQNGSLSSTYRSAW